MIEEVGSGVEMGSRDAVVVVVVVVSSVSVLLSSMLQTMRRVRGGRAGAGCLAPSLREIARMVCKASWCELCG